MKNGFVRRLAAAGVALAVGTALAACSGGGSGSTSTGGDVKAGGYSGPKVTVTFWNGFTGGAGPTVLKQLVSEFNSSHKNIAINSVPMEWADIASKMPLAIKAGKGPDVTVVHGSDVATYAAQGLLLKADSIAKTLKMDDSQFPQGLYKNGQYQGAQYALPWSVTPLGLYINKDVLKKAGLDEDTVPTDAASMDKALSALRAKGVQGEWVDPYFFTGVMQFESLLWQFGGTPYNSDVTKATFNSEAGVKALNVMLSRIKQGDSPAKVAQDGDINALIAGKTAFNWNGIWQTSNSALQGKNWTAAAVPQIGTQKGVWSSSTDWAFVNNKGQDSNKTQAASVFVQWMNEHSLAWAETGELPATNSVRESSDLTSKYPNLKPFLAELDYAHFEQAAPGSTNADAEINTAVNEAILQKKSPQQALDDAAKQADQLLQQNQQQYGY